MAEVLSQSQIDALLASMNGGGAKPAAADTPPEKKYRKYDFYSPRKFTKDRIKMLKGIFDNYARAINTRISGLLHTTCEVEVDSVEEQRYYEFSNALPDGAVVALTNLELKGKHHEVPVIIFATIPVMLSMMDRMMGGDGGVDNDSSLTDYVYTNLELQLYENLMRGFIDVLPNSWETYIHLNFEFNRVEPNPTLVQLIGLDDTVILVDINIRFPNCDGRLSICLPGQMLFDIFTEINAEKPTRTALEEDKSDVIYGHLQDSNLEIIAELGRTVLQLHDIYHLNVGDVINLNQKQDTTVSLRVGGRRWFSGFMGIHDKHLAVKIKDVYHTEDRAEVEKGGPQDGK